jgi:hypothetical protein
MHEWGAGLKARTLPTGVGWMQEALTLLAYQQPSNSPEGHLFGERPRRRCADAANALLMQLQGASKDSRLELLCQQAAAVRNELLKRDCVETRVIRLQSLYETPLESGTGSE